MTTVWHVSKEWPGERAFIIGGGPSLKGFDGERLRGKGRIIAVNNSGFDIAPFADVLFWADKRWLDWNHGRLGEHTGKYKVTRKRPHLPLKHDVKYIEFRPSVVVSDVRYMVGGYCGGSSAINLAYLMGAREILLLGFDMRSTVGNYHDDHKEPCLPGQHENKFIPVLERMAPMLAERGVRVVNVTPGSALECFEKGNLDDYA